MAKCQKLVSLSLKWKKFHSDVTKSESAFQLAVAKAQNLDLIASKLVRAANLMAEESVSVATSHLRRHPTGTTVQTTSEVHFSST